MCSPIQPPSIVVAVASSDCRGIERRFGPILCLVALLAASGQAMAADVPSDLVNLNKGQAKTKSATAAASAAKPTPQKPVTPAPAAASDKAKSAPVAATRAKTASAPVTKPAVKPAVGAVAAKTPAAAPAAGKIVPPVTATAAAKAPAPTAAKRTATAKVSTGPQKSESRVPEFSDHVTPPPAGNELLMLAAMTEPAVAVNAKGQIEDPDPLPAKTPDRFNPDPGGRQGPVTSGPPPEAAAPVVPNLFEPVLPQQKPTDYGDQHPIPYKLRLSRRADLVSNEVINQSVAYPQYELSEGNIGLLPNAIPQTNRWRIPFGEFQRYPGNPETPYGNGPLRFFDPFKASLLKGDSPIIGQDIFLSLTFEDQIIAEFRRTPVGSAVSSARPQSSEFFGRSESYTLQNNFSTTIELFRGETAFKPIDWAVHITPIFNINFSEFKENGIVSPDPRGPNYDASNPNQGLATTIRTPGDVNLVLGNDLHNIGQKDLARTRYTQRTRETVSLEEAFVEIHLHDLSDNYDFASVRIGNQLLNSDFRGFIFNDTNSAIRVFGNYDNNHLQYNAAYFNQREKDTFSNLNQYSARGQDILIFNLYRTDALNLFLPASDNLALGYTAQLSLHVNLDHGDLHYDKTGTIVRPAPIGVPIVEHEVNTAYLGWAGDGHIGWLNITHAFYEVLGRDDHNGIAGRPVSVNAQMFALELSRDYDYLRPKFSFLYASGDSNAKDSHANGFDSIQDSPTFIGNPFSFYARQGFGLANASILTKPGNSLLLDLRTSKSEGQANYVNPGTLIVGLGLDAEITPKLRLQFNANYIRMVDPDAVKVALFANKVDRELGYDISLGFTYRPLLSENIIINAGFGAFLPGRGYRDIYRELTNPVPGFTNDPSGEIDSFLYSGLIAITLRY